jgi:hypothetical protein
MLLDSGHGAFLQLSHHRLGEARRLKIKVKHQRVKNLFTHNPNFP